MGYAEPIAIQLYDFFSGIIYGKDVSPNFYDGLKNNEIIDAVATSLSKRELIVI